MTDEGRGVSDNLQLRSKCTHYPDYMALASHVISIPTKAYLA